MSGTPYYIAAGLASGGAVSFTPLIGLHFVLGAILAFVLRGSPTAIRPVMDTVLILPDEGVYVVVWRSAFACDKDLLKVSSVVVDVPVPAAVGA